jgi:RNA polymerase sigma-70 factor (ECF subfamily)
LGRAAAILREISTQVLGRKILSPVAKESMGSDPRVRRPAAYRETPAMIPVSGEQSDTQFVQLFARYQTQLFRYVASLVPHLQDAEDVLGQATIVLWENFDAFSPGTSFLAWARRIAYLRVLEFYRQSARRPLLSEGLIEQLAREMEDRDEVSMRRLAALPICLEKLPAADRDLIQRRYRENVKGIELARQLGRPVNSVYKSLGRIRRALLRCIERRLGAEASA